MSDGGGVSAVDSLKVNLFFLSGIRGLIHALEASTKGAEGQMKNVKKDLLNHAFS